MIAFHLPIVPPRATSQGAGKRIQVVKGRPRFFKNRRQESAEHDYMLLCAPYRPAAPMAGPVALTVDFVFPWRAGEPRRNRSLGRMPKTTKPDGGNMLKALEDCLTKLGFWFDDAQVADERVTRAWGDQVGVYVAITPIHLELPLFATQTQP